MNRRNILIMFGNLVYFIGVTVVLGLIATALFGSNEIANPQAMLPISWKEAAFMYLMYGSIPMLLASNAFYKLNDIRNTIHRKRNFILIFIPGFICVGCTLFVMGILFVGMINSSVFH